MLNKIVDNITAAPLRLILLVLAFFVLHQLLTKQNMAKYDYRFFLVRFSIYGALTLISIFLLIQLNMYHIFSVLALLLVLIGLRYFNLRELIAYSQSGGRFRRATLLGFFRFIEKRETIVKKNFKNMLTVLRPKKVDYGFFLILMVGISAVIARVVFLENDVYTFSNLWVQTLEIVKNFDNNQWFVRGRSQVVGELAAMNFYANLVGISKEMAIYTFGLLESFLMAAFVFYTVNALTNSRYFAPLVAGISFACLFAFLPININTLFQHSSIYLSLLFALPLLIFSLIPAELGMLKRRYFKIQLALAIATAFTDFYIMFIILPVFFVVAWTVNFGKKSVGQTVLAYLGGVVFVLSFKVVVSFIKNIDFLTYFLGNIIVFESYSYTPQLLVSESQLGVLFIALGLSALFAALVLLIFFKAKKRAALTFILFYLALLVINSLEVSWLDADLFNQTLTVLVPIIIGFNVSLFGKLVEKLSPTLTYVYSAVVAGIMIFLIFQGYSHSLRGQKFQDVNKLKIDLLKVYDQLSTYQMKNSYAIVNEAYGVKLSGKEHIFINYQDFLENYLERDSVYHQIKEDVRLLNENPEYILPSSVFVFISDTTRTNAKDYFLKTPGEVANALNAQLQQLKNRGRQVNTYYTSEQLKVLEIVNNANGSNLNDMIFAYEKDK